MSTSVGTAKFCTHTKRVGFLNSKSVKESFIEVTFRLTVKERLTAQGLEEKKSGYNISIFEHSMKKGGKDIYSISLVPLYDLDLDENRKGVEFEAARK